MTINWFPGHMATARKDIRAAMSDMDIVLEVLDARIPASSENPLVVELRGEKPVIQILNKADLADPAITAAWLEKIAETPNVRAVAHEQHQPGLARSLVALGRTMVPRKDRAMIAMILGIPNVGKSTLINAMAGRTIAKAENRPGVTTTQQRIRVGMDLVLLDTPGFLWPKLTPPARGYRLAITGAITDRVTDFQDLALFAARFMAERYPQHLVDHYGIPAVPEGEEPLLEAIAKRRGYLFKGGVPDMQRASERLVLDLRSGALGRISLEAPGRE